MFKICVFSKIFSAMWIIRNVAVILIKRNSWFGYIFIGVSAYGYALHLSRSEYVDTIVSVFRDC